MAAGFTIAYTFEDVEEILNRCLIEKEPVADVAVDFNRKPTAIAVLVRNYERWNEGKSTTGVGKAMVKHYEKYGNQRYVDENTNSESQSTPMAYVPKSSLPTPSYNTPDKVVSTTNDRSKDKTEKLIAKLDSSIETMHDAILDLIAYEVSIAKQEGYTQGLADATYNEELSDNTKVEESEDTSFAGRLRRTLLPREELE